MVWKSWNYIPLKPYKFVLAGRYHYITKECNFGSEVLGYGVETSELFPVDYTVLRRFDVTKYEIKHLNILKTSRDS